MRGNGDHSRESELMKINFFSLGKVLFWCMVYLHV